MQEFILAEIEERFDEVKPFGNIECNTIVYRIVLKVGEDGSAVVNYEQGARYGNYEDIDFYECDKTDFNIEDFNLNELQRFIESVGK